MPDYQLDSVDTTKLLIGNCTMEVATTAGATFTDLGAGMVSNWGHPITKYDTQAGNAPDPLEGIAEETVEVDFEMIEFDASVMNVMWGGAISASTSSSVQTIHAGGNTTITERAFRFTNTRLISSTTVQTILTVYKGTIETGPQFTLKSDNDADPIAVMPCKVIGKIDGTRTSGQQLYSLTHDVYPSS